MHKINKANVPHTCIDADATAVMSDGTLKRVDSLEIGDKVKTLDNNGNLIDTDVVMMMDISRKECKLLLMMILKSYIVFS